MICDNYPCTGMIDDNSVTRILELSTTPSEAGPGRLARNLALHFCSTACADEYYSRPTVVNVAPTRDAAVLLEKLTARQAAVEVEYATRLAVARAQAGRELEPLELKALREEAELEIPWVDGASGLFQGADFKLVATWRTGRGIVLDTFSAETPNDINTWWKTPPEAEEVTEDQVEDTQPEDAVGN